MRYAIARRSRIIAILVLGGSVASACGGRTDTLLDDDPFGESEIVASGNGSNGDPGQDGEPGQDDPSRPNPGRCGNGRIDDGEICDGQNLGGETCASATMGANPIGTLRCTSRCSFDTSSCRSRGTPGTGGTGGFTGEGGGVGFPGGRGGIPMGGYGGVAGYPPPPPPIGGYGGMSSPPQLACGREICPAFGGPLTLRSCCSGGNRCGLETTPIADAAGIPSGCVPINQPGEFDPVCPSQSTVIGELPGCCKPNGVCGVDWSFLSLGCVNTSAAGGPPRTRCGD